jgi:crossover junction endodeoxyribonuclease RusA
MSTTTFFVPGIPAPQGSKRYLGASAAGKPRFKESSDRVTPWRADIRNDAKVMFGEPTAGPVEVQLVFVLPRPKSHYRTGRNADLLRDTAPPAPAGKPDIDKLARAALDAMTNVAWLDDAQVTKLTLIKVYPFTMLPHPGMHVTVQEISVELPGATP